MQPECSLWTERGLCLSFLCSKTISVVFWGGTGINTGLDGGGWVGGYPPWDRMWLMGLGNLDALSTGNSGF